MIPEPTCDDVCERYYAETRRADPRCHSTATLPWLPAPRCNPEIALDEGASIPAPGLVSRLKQLALRVLGDSFPERAELTPALERWIEEFQPQVLYTILGSNGMMALIEKKSDTVSTCPWWYTSWMIGCPPTIGIAARRPQRRGACYNKED